MESPLPSRVSTFLNRFYSNSNELLYHPADGPALRPMMKIGTPDIVPVQELSDTLNQFPKR
jgi:hypothetical protein